MTSGLPFPPVPRPARAWAVGRASDVYAWLTAQDAWRASCAQLAAHLPAGSQRRVVDLGCGPGVSTFELARARPDAAVVGLDVTVAMLSQARRRLPRAGLGPPQIQWVRGDVARLPFRSASFDAVTTHSLLYYVSNRTAVLAESLRVLRPGGRFIAMEPSARPAGLRQTWRVSRDVRFLVSIVSGGRSAGSRAASVWLPDAPRSMEPGLAAAARYTCSATRMAQPTVRRARFFLHRRALARVVTELVAPTNVAGGLLGRRGHAVRRCRADGVHRPWRALSVIQRSPDPAQHQQPILLLVGVL